MVDRRLHRRALARSRADAEGHLSTLALRRLAIALAVLLPAALPAQSASSIRAELRVDHHATGTRSTEGGVGAYAIAGTYLRVGGVAAAGAASTEGSARKTARVETALRFLLDPFRERPFGVSVGGGVVARWTDGGGIEPYMLALLDVEGRGRWAPALQLALGGGVRIGLAVRPERRGVPRR